MSEPRSRSKSKDRSKNSSQSVTKDRQNNKNTDSRSSSYRNPYILDNRKKKYNNNDDRSTDRSWIHNNRYERYKDSPSEFNSGNRSNTNLNSNKNYSNLNNSNSHSNSSKYKKYNYESPYHLNKKKRFFKTRWDNIKSVDFDQRSSEYQQKSINLPSNNEKHSKINSESLNTNIIQENITDGNCTLKQNKILNFKNKPKDTENHKKTNNDNRETTNIKSGNKSPHKKFQYTNNFSNSKRKNFKQNLSVHNSDNRPNNKFYNKNKYFKKQNEKTPKDSNDVSNKDIIEENTNKNDILNIEINVKLKKNLKELHIKKFKNSKIIKPKLISRKKNTDLLKSSNNVNSISQFSSNFSNYKNNIENIISNGKENLQDIPPTNNFLENAFTESANLTESLSNLLSDNTTTELTEKAPKITLVPLNNLLKENILSEVNPENLLPDNILDIAKQDLTEKLVNKVAKMDKIGIKNIINNPATKFDEALKQKARQHLRDEIRKELRAIHYEHQNIDGLDIFDETFETNPLYNHEEISQAVLEQIRRKFGIDFLVEATSSETQPIQEDIDSSIVNTVNEINQKSDLSKLNCNNNTDNNIIADSTSSLNNNEQITSDNKDLNTNIEKNIKFSETNNFQQPSSSLLESPSSTNANLLNITDTSVSVSSVVSNEIKNILEIKMNSTTPSNITSKNEILLSPKNVFKNFFQEKSDIKEISKSSKKSFKKQKKSFSKSKVNIGFKENEILTIDSSSSSSDDSSSSSDSSTDSDSSSSSSSSSDDNKKSKKSKSRNLNLQAAVINKFRRLVLPNLSKYLQKKYDDKYSKTTSNSISFIYDVCLSKILKNSTLAPNAKKILKTKIKSLNRNDMLQFLFDYMKDLFVLSTQDKGSNENISASCKLIEKLNASTIGTQNNVEEIITNPTISNNNLIENIQSNNDIKKNENEFITSTITSTTDTAATSTTSTTTTPCTASTTTTSLQSFDLNPKKTTIQFDEKSLNLIANELKKFAEQQKNFINKNRTISQSSEKESLSSTTFSLNIDETSKNNSSTLNDNAITTVVEDETVINSNTNRISPIKNNSNIKHQTPNKFDDSNNTSSSNCKKNINIKESTDSINRINEVEGGDCDTILEGVKMNEINNSSSQNEIKNVLNEIDNKSTKPQENSKNPLVISQLENLSGNNNKSKNNCRRKSDEHIKLQKNENDLRNNEDITNNNLEENSELMFVKTERNTGSNNKEYLSSVNNAINNDDNIDNNNKDDNNCQNHHTSYEENTIKCMDNDENQKVRKNSLTKTSSSSSVIKLSEPENDSAEYCSNDGGDLNSENENEMYESENNSQNSSRLWKSPGEKKCIQILSTKKQMGSLSNIADDEEYDEIKPNTLNLNLKMKNSISNQSPSSSSQNLSSPTKNITNNRNTTETSTIQNSNFESIYMATLIQQNKLEEAVVSNLKEIDVKLLELHKRKMFVEEMILKLQKDKMEIDFSSMQLQNEKFLILNAALAKNNICNIQQQNSLVSFQSYLNSTNKMMNEPLSASDYISNMFSNNNNITGSTSTINTPVKRKRPNSQSSSISGRSLSKKLRSSTKQSSQSDDDDINTIKDNQSPNKKNQKNNEKESPSKNQLKGTSSNISNQKTKSPTIKSSPSKAKNTNSIASSSNVNIDNINNSNDDSGPEEEYNTESKEILKESKNCKNGSYSGFKLTITQIKLCNKFIIASSQDGNIYKYCWKTKKLLGKFSKHTESVTQMHIDKNNCIYSISLDGYLRKTSIEEFGLEMLSVNLEEPLQSIDIKWNTAYIGSKWGNVFNYNFTENKTSNFFQCSNNSTIVLLKATKIYNPKILKILIIGSKRDPINIINASNGNTIRKIETSQNQSITSSLLNEGILYCGFNKNVIEKYDIKTGCKLPTISCGGNGVIFMNIFKSDLLFIGCVDGSIYVVNKKTGKELHKINKFKLSDSIITTLEFVGEKVIYAFKNNKMQMEDLARCILSYK